MLLVTDANLSKLSVQFEGFGAIFLDDPREILTSLHGFHELFLLRTFTPALAPCESAAT